MMKIITVCGMGLGSSLMLKMTVEKAMSQLGIECSIDHWDMGTIKGQKCDFIVTTESFRNNLSEMNNVVYVKKMMDVSEAKEKISKYLEQQH
jgi:ascorbate PTS system EIIB component